MTKEEQIKHLEEELAEAKRDKDRALDLAEALKDIVVDQKTAKEYIPYPVPYPVDRRRSLQPYRPYWPYHYPYTTGISSISSSGGTYTLNGSTNNSKSQNQIGYSHNVLDAQQVSC